MRKYGHICENMIIFEETLNWTFHICAYPQILQIMQILKIWENLRKFDHISPNLTGRFFQMSVATFTT